MQWGGNPGVRVGAAPFPPLLVPTGAPPALGDTMGSPPRVPLVLLLLLAVERMVRGTFPEEPGPIAVAPPECEHPWEGFGGEGSGEHPWEGVLG